MTVPAIVMISSGLLWLVLVKIIKPKNQSPEEWPEVHRWLVDTCRILFAVSAFWVVAGVSGRSVL